MSFAFLLIIFFFGAIIGSFLNVVIFRMGTGRTVGGRSMCMHCGKQLHWHELIPLASFLHLRGKCSECKAKISWQYPAVEAITGILFVCVAFHFSYLLPFNFVLFIYHFIFSAFFWSLALVIAVYDLRHTIIPEPAVWYLLALALVSVVVFNVSNDAVVLRLPNLLELSSGIILALPFFLLWYFSGGRLMGLGDAKLTLGLGTFLGLWQGAASLMISFWMGAIVSLLLLGIKRTQYHLKSEIPFGPFLILGAFIVYLSGVDMSQLIGMFS